MTVQGMHELYGTESNEELLALLIHDREDYYFSKFGKQFKLASTGEEYEYTTTASTKITQTEN
jgi:hypothetical protein